MQIEKQLQEIGFEEKEAKVYLSSLQLGENTAFNIARRCDLKRSTTYFVLNNLVKKGLLSIKQTRKATLFSATNPNKLITQLKYREDVLTNLLPLLSAIYKYPEDKPGIQVYEGSGGLKQIYLEIVEFIKKGKEVLLFGDISHFSELKSLMDIWLNESKNKRYKVRELLNHREKNGDYIKQIGKNKNPNHQIKLVPENFVFMENDNVIYGNKFLQVSLKTFSNIINSSLFIFRKIFYAGYDCLNVLPEITS